LLPGFFAVVAVIALDVTADIPVVVAEGSWLGTQLLAFNETLVGGTG